MSRCRDDGRLGCYPTSVWKEEQFLCLLLLACRPTFSTQSWSLNWCRPGSALLCLCLNWCRPGSALLCLCLNWCRPGSALLCLCLSPPPAPRCSMAVQTRNRERSKQRKKQPPPEPPAAASGQESGRPRQPLCGRKRSPGRRGARDQKGSDSRTSYFQHFPPPPPLQHCQPPHRLQLLYSMTAALREKLGLRRAARFHHWSSLFLAAFAGILHWSHISSLFENDRNFSHLSALEREMAFRTEMGLYYSYFKTMVEAPSFSNGLWMIMNDRLTEYPLVINTLKRFNLYPEVILAIWYRMYKSTMDVFGIQTKICWTVNRGDGLSAVESCEGLGDPASFYVSMIFALNGLMMTLFFIYGTYLSGSRLGGLVTVMCYFFNHGECTRVMWTPPLRESFSYPFLVLQMLLITHILRTSNIGRGSLIALCVSNVFFMLPWQFAQFVLLTQIASLFAIYVMGYIDSLKLQKILYTHMGSLGLCFLLMFGNSMLLTSYYAASLIVIWGITIKRAEFLKCGTTEPIIWVAQGLAWLLGTIILKLLISYFLGVADDAHIGNLLKSKFTNYKDFDTLMYTCAAEFDFMEKETPVRYAKTLLLPVVVLVCAAILVKPLKEMRQILSQPFGLPSMSHRMDERREQSSDGELIYHVLQLVAYTVLGVLIMRLKLFLTPHMCVMASLICSKQLFGWLFNKFHPQTIIFTILALMMIQGSSNLQTQWNVMGQFSNLPQEELLGWIKVNTRPNAVFAGAMPTMASVKLSTGRAIVNHPHYEDAGLRARTKIVYSMYSRKPAKEMKKELIKLGVNYYILEESWCVRRTKPGCSMPEIWDVEDPVNAGKTPLCALMAKESRPYFSTVFQNSVYKVLKVMREQ
ncbi:probable C-mannosyltransferase DPY19L1 isoform X2 [Rhinatrema bivittatum]|uniref:probable C-mannosyltransferase DPY19L1 isoform X2 n=1 Tax=Rhinatrema bivittatum TaxID=194408 RepID=UPI00112961C1|nr:probable C-mannosyltransferase DPY19L1 isoform X2 [Rhinatrema bivittatum]